MKIAYLILCHIDPAHICRLAKKLTEGTQNEVFVHVDGKCDVHPFEETLSGLERVHLLSHRVKVHWGGYSAVEATILLMRTALAAGDFGKYILLQGLEYPIKSNREIDRFLEADPKREYMLAQNISRIHDVRQEHKYRLFYVLDHAKCLPLRVMHKINKTMMLHQKVPHLKPDFVKDCHGRKMEIYAGCAQFGLTQEAVRYIVQFHDENPGFNRYFKTVYAVDEAYFHTILYNSEFVTFTQEGQARERPKLTDFENLTYFEYPKYIRLFTSKEEWPILRDSGFLYFRKASSESKELLDYIDALHQNEE